MLNECALSVTPEQSLGLTLKVIWKVNADLSYDVYARSREKSGYIAIRTLKGEGTLFFEKKGVFKVQGSTFFVFEFDKVERYFCSGKSWNFFWFEFNAINTGILPLFKIMKIPATPEEIILLETAFSLLRRNQPTSNLAASSHLEFLISTYVHNWSSQSRPFHPHEKGIEKVIEVMTGNLSGLSVKDMAKAAFLSERRFRQVFENITGKPPKRFYDILRLKMAASLLINTQKTLEEIADDLGFSSAFHFSRAFKGLYGLPPSVYREKL
jgi:AraC-like DNA-binding protein